MSRLLTVALVAAGLAACTGGVSNVRPSREDPSNPFAPEARVEPASRTLEGGAPAWTREEPPPEPAPAHEHHHEHGAAPGHVHASTAPAPTVYACPMHPEVRQAEPGRCPKCKMKLVSQNPAGGDES